jgi:hypothetical protein
VFLKFVKLDSRMVLSDFQAPKSRKVQMSIVHVHEA